VFYLRPKKNILLSAKFYLKSTNISRFPKTKEIFYIQVFTPPIAPLDPRGFLRGKGEGMRGQCPLPSISEGREGEEARW